MPRGCIHRYVPKPEISAPLVAALELIHAEIGTALGPTPLVYYPCCGLDVSPSQIWGSAVRYADRDELGVRVLTDAKFEATVADARRFNPGSVDLLIMMNPAIPPNGPLQRVRSGGYIIANDYHSTATQIHDRAKFKFVGLVTYTAAHQPRFIREPGQLELFWAAVRTDDEFKHAGLFAGSVTYDEAARIVHELTGRRENILTEYQRIVAEQRAILRRQAAAAKNRIEAAVIYTEGSEPMMTMINNRSYGLWTKLPRLLGSTASLALFRRT